MAKKNFFFHFDSYLQCPFDRKVVENRPGSILNCFLLSFWSAGLKQLDIFKVSLCARYCNFWFFDFWKNLVFNWNSVTIEWQKIILQISWSTELRKGVFHHPNLKISLALNATRHFLRWKLHFNSAVQFKRTKKNGLKEQAAPSACEKL